MNSIYFIAFLPAAAIGLGFCIRYALSRTVSTVTSERIRRVEASQEMAPVLPGTARELLPLLDISSLYLESRRLVKTAHRIALRNLGDEELRQWEDEAEGKHAELKQLLRLSAAEKILGTIFRSRFPLYTRAALWTFVEELTIVSEMQLWTASHAIDQLKGF